MRPVRSVVSAWAGAKAPDRVKGCGVPAGPGHSARVGGWARVGIEAMPAAVPLLTRPRPSL